MNASTRKSWSHEVCQCSFTDNWTHWISDITECFALQEKMREGKNLKTFFLDWNHIKLLTSTWDWSSTSLTGSYVIPKVLSPKATGLWPGWLRTSIGVVLMFHIREVLFSVVYTELHTLTSCLCFLLWDVFHRSTRSRKRNGRSAFNGTLYVPYCSFLLLAPCCNFDHVPHSLK